MTRYGFMKSTEFTKKQINVVYAKAKSGLLKIEKWFINELYSLAEFYGYDDNGAVENCEERVLKILNSVFLNNINEAQNLIDSTSNYWFNGYTERTQSKIDRTQFVA